MVKDPRRYRSKLVDLPLSIFQIALKNRLKEEQRVFRVLEEMPKRSNSKSVMRLLGKDKLGRSDTRTYLITRVSDIGVVNYRQMKSMGWLAAVLNMCSKHSRNPLATRNPPQVPSESLLSQDLKSRKTQRETLTCPSSARFWYTTSSVTAHLALFTSCAVALASSKAREWLGRS